MKFIDCPPVAQRSIDVSYRSRRCDYWLGSLAHEKQLIAEKFVQYAKGSGLNLDVSIEESARVYGAGWINLLMNSKAVLGTESGASIWDFDGDIVKQTQAFLRKNKKAVFDDVYEHVLKPHDGQILYNAISPRVFEAAATKTPMIMFPGDYNEICKPDVHYIMLEKDFSNISDVIQKIKDIDYLQSLADRTYIDLIESNRYSQHELSKIVSETLLPLIKGVQTSSHGVVSYLDEALHSHRMVNRLRCFYTESRFIVGNFFDLLFEPQDTFLKKGRRLLAGLKRYLAYVLPRIKNSSS